MNTNALKFRRAAEALDAQYALNVFRALILYFKAHPVEESCPLCEFFRLFNKTPADFPGITLLEGEHGVIALLLAGEMERTGDLHL